MGSSQKTGVESFHTELSALHEVTTFEYLALKHYKSLSTVCVTGLSSPKMNILSVLCELLTIVSVQSTAMLFLGDYVDSNTVHACELMTVLDCFKGAVQ